MRSNSFNRYFGFTTFGESHGKAFGVVFEDVKPNVPFPYDELNLALSLRKPGSNIFTSNRLEKDSYEILSGVFEGKTTGMPISIIFRNNDINSSVYDIIQEVFKPGHVDYSWFNKFKIYDYRGSGRASGRETISRVAASALISDVIRDIKIEFQTVSIGSFVYQGEGKYFTPTTDNPFCWANPDQLDELSKYLKEIKKEKDSVGGIIHIRINNVPIGLGDPVFEKLNANLSKAILSIGTIKGIIFGEGIELATKKGSEISEELTVTGYNTNHLGGIIGGITNGSPITMQIFVRPVSSHGKPQKTINKRGQHVDLTIEGRHDICHIPRLIPVVEAMIKLTLADAIAWQKLLSGSDMSLSDYREHLDKIDEEILLTLFRRKKIVEQVEKYKREHNIDLYDPQREEDIMQQIEKIAIEYELPPHDINEIFRLILKVCKI